MNLIFDEAQLVNERLEFNLSALGEPVRLKSNPIRKEACAPKNLRIIYVIRFCDLTKRDYFELLACDFANYLAKIGELFGNFSFFRQNTNYGSAPNP